MDFLSLFQSYVPGVPGSAPSSPVKNNKRKNVFFDFFATNSSKSG
jgi:hypothetical protein